MIRQLAPYQLAVDIVIAAMFGLVLLPIVLGDGLAGVIVHLGMTVSLALRRLSPGLALAIAWVSVFVQLGSGMQAIVPNVAILAVLYTTGSYGDRLSKWAGLASACIGGVVAAVYTTLVLYAGTAGSWSVNEVSQVVFTSAVGSIAAVFVFGLSWTLGLLARTTREARVVREQQFQALEQQRLAQQAVVVEQERNRIARDMHDVVAHSLAVVIAQADGSRYAHRGDPEALGETLGTVADTAREALADVRLLLSELRHRQGDGPQPVVADLERLIEQMGAAGLDVRTHEYGTRAQMPAGHQIALYRIVQEALTNALRHGDTGHPVSLELWWIEQGVSFRIENAMVSPSVTRPAAAGIVGGHGLPGMRERAELTGGWLAIEVRDGRFRVSGALAPAHVGGSGS
ncbi:sensor histidine kinase [Okibacterium endophyticum]